MRVAYIAPDASDPLAFYRGSGPLAHLCKTQENFQYEYIDSNITWASLLKFDLVFLQRPFQPDHLKVCEIATKWNIPIVADFDDWLYDLPPSNPAYAAFNAQKKTLVQIVNALNGIIVANEHLKTMIKTLLLDQEKRIDVIPNAYNLGLVKKYRHPKNVKERKMIFAWRGGTSHGEDILSVKEDYLKLFKEFPAWQFVFIAQNPWILEAKDFPNVQTSDGLKVAEYFRAIHDTAPAIVAHPLSDNDFNRCKSMCSWLEATHARSAFIGPDFEEFKRPGVLNYGKNRSFFDAAHELLSNPEKILEYYKTSEEYIMENLTLDKINPLRMKAFEAVL